MKFDKSILLNELREMTFKHLEFVGLLKSKPESSLLFRPAADSWHVLECIEHLVRYANFYIPEMQARISKNTDGDQPVFQSGFLGEKFAKMMLPKPGMKKMKTFKNMDPKGCLPDASVLNTMDQQLNELLNILDECSNKNLNKIKTSISISKLIKLRLGDTLRVLVYHNDRHIIQAQQILEVAQKATAFSIQ